MVKTGTKLRMLVHKIGGVSFRNSRQGHHLPEVACATTFTSLRKLCLNSSSVCLGQSGKANSAEKFERDRKSLLLLALRSPHPTFQEQIQFHSRDDEPMSNLRRANFLPPYQFTHSPHSRAQVVRSSLNSQAAGLLNVFVRNFL